MVVKLAILLRFMPECAVLAMLRVVVILVCLNAFSTLGVDVEMRVSGCIFKPPSYMRYTGYHVPGDGISSDIHSQTMLAKHSYI